MWTQFPLEPHKDDEDDDDDDEINLQKFNLFFYLFIFFTSRHNFLKNK